jgi:MYXO-CTERM domain-containing protein
MVKDTRLSLGKMGYTDRRGFYKVTLHLHNENQGDPILVTAREQEQRIAATFDSKNLHDERSATVNFGSGCVTDDGSSPWVYYSLGLGIAAAAAVAGATLMRKRRQPVKRGKGKRK